MMISPECKLFIITIIICNYVCGNWISVDCSNCIVVSDPRSESNQNLKENWKIFHEVNLEYLLASDYVSFSYLEQ